MSETALSGEGDTKLVRRTRVRVECDSCGEPADQRHTYLLPRARANPASSAYGHDDCSWCSDHEEFTCADCRGRWNNAPNVDGYELCSTFKVGERFAHLFLRWDEKEEPTHA